MICIISRKERSGCSVENILQGAELGDYCRSLCVSLYVSLREHNGLGSKDGSRHGPTYHHFR